jgi:predicted metal-dependent peptidase
MTAEAIYDQLIADAARDQRFSAAGPRDTASTPTQMQSGIVVSGMAQGRLADTHVEPSEDAARPFLPVNEPFPSADERRRLRQELAKGLMAKLAGTAAGRALAEVRAATERSVPWEALLRTFFTGIRRTDYRLYPFHRKHLWRGICLPSLGAPGPQHLVVAVDTSGSMSDELLSRIAGELDHLRGMTECKLTMLHFDTCIEHVVVRESYESSEMKKSATFFGRGGTDIRAPFEWLATEARAGRLFPPADALVVVTDGFGPMPVREPGLPVLWLTPSAGVQTFPFGTVIPIAPRWT